MDVFILVCLWSDHMLDLLLSAINLPEMSFLAKNEILCFIHSGGQDTDSQLTLDAHSPLREQRHEWRLHIDHQSTRKSNLAPLSCYLSA